MNIDPNTGLPQLPEQLFWRVTYSRTMRWYELQLRKKLTIGSRKLGWWAMWPYEFKQSQILFWAKYAMGQTVVQDKIIRATGAKISYDIDQLLLGDYPPNKLNTPITIQEEQ